MRNDLPGVGAHKWRNTTPLLSPARPLRRAQSCMAPSQILTPARLTPRASRRRQDHSRPKLNSRYEIADNKIVTSITSRMRWDHPKWRPSPVGGRRRACGWLTARCGFWLRSTPERYGHRVRSTYMVRSVQLPMRASSAAASRGSSVPLAQPPVNYGSRRGHTVARLLRWLESSLCPGRPVPRLAQQRPKRYVLNTESALSDRIARGRHRASCVTLAPTVATTAAPWRSRRKCSARSSEWVLPIRSPSQTSTSSAYHLKRLALGAIAQRVTARRLPVPPMGSSSTRTTLSRRACQVSSSVRSDG